MPVGIHVRQMGEEHVRLVAPQCIQHTGLHKIVQLRLLHSIHHVSEPPVQVDLIPGRSVGNADRNLVLPGLVGPHLRQVVADSGLARHRPQEGCYLKAAPTGLVVQRSPVDVAALPEPVRLTFLRLDFVVVHNSVIGRVQPGHDAGVRRVGQAGIHADHPLTARSPLHKGPEVGQCPHIRQIDAPHCVQ